MKESDTSCEFAIDLNSAPGVKTLIITSRAILFRSQKVCQLLLPALLDSEVLTSTFLDNEALLESNKMDITRSKDVGCFGVSSEDCPHPNSLHKKSVIEEYKQSRAKIFPED